MTALIQKAYDWVWGTSGGEPVDRVGVYKADYSRLTDAELDAEDFECVELIKNSSPVSR